MPGLVGDTAIDRDGADTAAPPPAEPAAPVDELSTVDRRAL